MRETCSRLNSRNVNTETKKTMVENLFACVIFYSLVITKGYIFIWEKIEPHTSLYNTSQGFFNKDKHLLEQEGTKTIAISHGTASKQLSSGVGEHPKLDTETHDRSTKEPEPRFRGRGHWGSARPDTFTSPIRITDKSGGQLGPTMPDFHVALGPLTVTYSLSFTPYLAQLFLYTPLPTVPLSPFCISVWSHLFFLQFFFFCIRVQTQPGTDPDWVPKDYCYC